MSGQAHLCIRPACGLACSDCSQALTPQQQRSYAIRYAILGDGWIAVGDQLPAKNTEVLIAFAESPLPSTGQYTGLARDHDGWSYPEENALWPGESSERPDGGWPTVKYWQPLPAHPDAARAAQAGDGNHA